MATQAQISDWITKARTLFGDAIELFARYQRLELEARLTGRVVMDNNGNVTTILTNENFQGENEGLNAQGFAATFARLGVAFAMVDDDLTTLLLEHRL